MALEYQFPFAFDLMQELGVSANTSMLISPVSLIFALSMAYTGAKGETRNEFDRFFRSKNSAALEDDLHEFLLKANGSFCPVVKLCNRGYVATDMELKADHQSKIESLFHARFRNVNFDERKETIRIINEEVSELTNGRIPQIADEDLVNKDTRLILLNSLHFEGEWEEEFTYLYHGEFFSSQEQKRPIKMMNKMSAEFGYAETREFRVVRLSFASPDFVVRNESNEIPDDPDLYVENHPFGSSLLVFLPRQRFGLSEAFASLDTTTMKSVLETLWNQNVNVTIPQFEFENEQELAKPIKRMGFAQGFSLSANFSAMTNEEVHIDEIVQKSKIKVTQFGIEATAATALKTSLLSDSSRESAPSPIQFEVDQPFAYFIVSERGDILFMGTFY